MPLKKSFPSNRDHSFTNLSWFGVRFVFMSGTFTSIVPGSQGILITEAAFSSSSRTTVAASIFPALDQSRDLWFEASNPRLSELSLSDPPLIINAKHRPNNRLDEMTLVTAWM